MWRAIAAATAKPPDVETINALYHPDHVLTSDWGVEGRTYRGARGFLEAMADTDAAWQEWRQEVEDVLDAGEKGVVVLVRLKARGRESGAPVDQPWAMVITLRDGKLGASHTFLDRGQALRAAGLKEQRRDRRPPRRLAELPSRTEFNDRIGRLKALSERAPCGACGILGGRMSANLASRG